MARIIAVPPTWNLSYLEPVVGGFRKANPDPEWLSKVRSRSEASILAGLPKDKLEIANALSIPPRMVEYLLSRPGWIPRL
jgi:hypothetical protein